MIHKVVTIWCAVILVCFFQEVIRSVTKTKLVCCSGWTSSSNGFCDLAICGGRTNPQGACNIYHLNDYVTYHKDGQIQRSSGGTCPSPDGCENCNYGFYSTGDNCRICPFIANCDERDCKSQYDYKCVWCKYENLHSKYNRAYKYDENQKSCRQTCSWQSDSTRCFPGECINEYRENCICQAGFGGPQCTEITNQTTLLRVEANFYDDENTKVYSPENPGNPTNSPTKWTNNIRLNKLELTATATYHIADPVTRPNDEHFVKTFYYGIINGQMKAYFIRDEAIRSIFPPAKENCNASCHKDSPCPVNSHYGCQIQVDVGALELRHGDQINISIELENGGYLIYKNRDDRFWYNDQPTEKQIWPSTKVYLSGKKTTEIYLFHWDTVVPFHDCVKSSCTSHPVDVPDVTKSNDIHIQWDDWSDSLSGIDYYDYEVYELHAIGSQDEHEITEKTTPWLHKTNITELESSFQVEPQGMYSVIFNAFDKAGNHRTARGLFLYDNNTDIELSSGSIVIENAAQYRDKSWITYRGSTVHVKWKDKFIKTQHYKHQWLEKVKHFTSGDEDEPYYEDDSGNRTASLVPNVKGIVKFEIAHHVYGTSLKSSSPFTIVTDVYTEAASQFVTWSNGDKLVVTIRAFDLLDNFRDENVTVYKDTTPPVITNLWLTKGDRVNIAVHRLEEFNKMTIEWDTYDFDSGISHLSWKLYDNFTTSTIVHGEIDLQGQGEMQNISQCQDKYKDHIRGPACYCTHYTGCYHKHFHVEPEISEEAGNGVLHNKSRGTHESDYFIDVNVTNMANLQSLHTIKITIDITPPVVGHIHDGIRGSPEVDYQQDLRLDAHWEGFFDHESGIAFYQYTFAQSCMSKDHFMNKTANDDTYNTYGSFVAPSEGTYYVTVVAYNRANDMSDPVCSDGVTITTDVPLVKNVVVKDARTEPRLVRDDDNVEWYIDETLQRYKLENVSEDCRLWSNIHESITIFPSVTAVKNAEYVCHAIRSNATVITRVLPKNYQLNITWISSIDSTLVHDYEVGLSSTADNVAPDIMEFHSSKHHPYILINHFGVPDGKIFFIIIKSISKSNVIGFQSIGPIVIDSTAPQFIGGPITSYYSSGYLIANWSAVGFQDTEDPYPLRYEYAVGNSPYAADVTQYMPIVENGPFTFTSSFLCTEVNVFNLKWQLHGHHEYYITIKAINTATLSATQTSLPYIHDVMLPSKGVVIDVPTQASSIVPLQDIEDIDYTDQTDSLSVRWGRFNHQHLDIEYHVCVGTEPGYCNTSPKIGVNGSDTMYKFSSLSLTYFQTYYMTVFAEATTGIVNVSSDGVMVINPEFVLSDIQIVNQKNCTGSYLLNKTHHIHDTRPSCVEGPGFQTSTDSLSVYVEIPQKYLPFITHAFYTIEQRHYFGDFWETFYNMSSFIAIHSQINVSANQLQLAAGRTYRFSLKFCVDTICYPPVISHGVTVIPSKPVAGTMDIEYIHQNETGTKLVVTYDEMYDPDILDQTERRSVVDVYEYSLMDNIDGVHHPWSRVENKTRLSNSQLQFTIPLLAEMDFTKCRKLALRGYNKAGVWTTSSAEIVKCNLIGDNQLVVPKIVVDAIGDQQFDGDGSVRDGYGKEVFLEENARWTTADVDYTPYKNILSAVWHSLRHNEYTWGVIEVKALDVLTYYKSIDNIQIRDPCSHADVIECGHTENNYVNVLFNADNLLKNGKRYVVCIHAPAKTVHHEKWSEDLDEVNECSDGLIVDLTPPIPGHVWIGSASESVNRISTSDMFVQWEAFTDIEEFEGSSHSSGIYKYYVAIGSVEGGSDVVEYTDVGVVNHVTFHNMSLQNGHNYYATVKGLDFSGRFSLAYSTPVKIDNTPPLLSSKSITISGRHITNFSEINACWTDVFYDMESGIKSYHWAVGSKPRFSDVVQYSETTEQCGTSIDVIDKNVHDGHAYFITVKAINKANLVSTASSWAHIYDKSPPVGGHIYDGFFDGFSKKNDIDFQTDKFKIGASWEGFFDAHTPIKVYKVAIGTCPGCDNIVQTHEVGVIYNFTIYTNLAIGIRYYTTVTACNTADLCTSVTSDGVVIDTSPPNVGTVKDGADYTDQNYQSFRNYVAATWRGFNDPQSGLHKFIIRVGTTVGGDELISPKEVPITDIITLTNLEKELPLTTRIYVTVRAYNKAGLYSESTSNGLIIDDTPPMINQKPELFNDLGSIVDHSVLYRSCFKVTWEVYDEESFIERQFISITSHRGGEINTTTTKVRCDEESFIERQFISITSHRGGEINTTTTKLNGIVREYTYTGLNLHDGGMYYVNLISCNGAKICVNKTSDGFLVDNSPPISGTFAIHTDHAGNPNRQIPGWMVWSTYKLWLSWLGFNDLHSNINYYMVSIGSEYMMNDLNQDGKPKKFLHNSTGLDRGDEGKVQTFEVDTTKLTDYSSIFVSIWAVNNVGLRSDMLHNQFRLVAGGILELVRRCTAATCLGHCVCSPKDQRCPFTYNSCINTSGNNTNTLIAVYDVTNVHSDEAPDVMFTPSHDALAARWGIVQVQGHLPKWYEWSVGLTDSDEPEGIIDSSVENVWHPCGQLTNAVYTLPRGRKLDDLISYSFFVRAWYDINTFADFKSNGVTVISRPLTTTNIVGAGVKESLPGHWKKDIDVMLRGGLFIVSWQHAFVRASTIIKKFHVYLSTFPGGHDTHTVNIDLPGSVSSVNISRVPLIPRVWYYSNVIGYSYAGQHVTLSSDGFTVDVDKPYVGVVNDGIGNVEVDYQNSSQIVGASWHGFGDLDSGITHYEWCCQFKQATKDCDVIPFVNVGIQTSISRTINESVIKTGNSIVSKVLAVDFVGHKSDIAVSNGVVIDTTPPLPVRLTHVEDTVLINPSFENSDSGFVEISNITSEHLCDYSLPNNWNYSNEDCVCVIGSSTVIAMDGRSFLFVRGSVWQTLHNLKPGHTYSVKFFTAHPSFVDSVHSTKEGFIELGIQRHVFLIHERQDKHGSETDISWHTHNFFFTVHSESVNITLGSVYSSSGIAIDHIQIFRTVPSEVDTESNHVLSHAVWLHSWSSIHSSWQFVDQESPIVEYLWAIGYKEGSTEIQNYRSVGLNTFAYNYNITLAHTSQVHVTVVAINAAGLSAKATASALFIDLTPPEIDYVYDGIGYDIDTQTTDEIIVNWQVKDPESNIGYCEWAVGYSSLGNEIQAFSRITAESTSVAKVFDHSLLSGKTVYTTLRCHNTAGLYSSKSSDGVTILNKPPSSSGAQIDILPQPVTEYQSKEMFSGNSTSVQLQWTGFTDHNGLDSYLITFENHNKSVSVSKTVLYEHNGNMYCNMYGFDLRDGPYSTTVRAVNSAYLKSDPVMTNVTIFTGLPVASDEKTYTIKEENRTLTVRWEKVFTSTYSLYYEVSVGTSANGADIIQWQETTTEYLIMYVPLNVKLYKGISLYVTITAIGVNGKYTTKNIILTL